MIKKQGDPYQRKECILVIIVVLTVCFIWGNSLVKGTDSGTISKFAKEIINSIIGVTGSAGMSGDGTLRKIAHATEYGILGLEMTGLFYVYRKKTMQQVLFLGMITAFLDETIQLFVPGRSGEIRDVWIDLGGFLAGMLLIFGNRMLHKKRDAKRDVKGHNQG